MWRTRFIGSLSQNSVASSTLRRKGAEKGSHERCESLLTEWINPLPIRSQKSPYGKQHPQRSGVAQSEFELIAIISPTSTALEYDCGRGGCYVTPVGNVLKAVSPPEQVCQRGFLEPDDPPSKRERQTEARPKKGAAHPGTRLNRVSRRADTITVPAVSGGFWPGAGRPCQSLR